MTAERLVSGTVAAFDSARGLGQVDAGGTMVSFHCVEIADGSREIESGQAVWFRAVRKFGRVEAANLMPRPV
jgi:cold shock CspA family protein